MRRFDIPDKELLPEGFGNAVGEKRLARARLTFDNERLTQYDGNIDDLHERFGCDIVLASLVSLFAFLHVLEPPLLKINFTEIILIYLSPVFVNEGAALVYNPKKRKITLPEVSAGQTHLNILCRGRHEFLPRTGLATRKAIRSLSVESVADPPSASLQGALYLAGKVAKLF